MSHVDGHCASPAETIYIQNDTSICSDTIGASDPGAGTAGKPLCSMQPLLTFLSATKDLVVVRGTVTAGTWNFAGQGATQTTIVGQQTAFLGNFGTPAFSMQAGSVYFRNLEMSSTATVGLSVTGGTITLESVLVDNCKQGGILLDGAAFDISNTTISNNNKATFNGTTTWGGILINNPPAMGPSRLDLLTVQGNVGGGITCSTSITSAMGVLAEGTSMGVDISSNCGFSSCQTASATCGAQ